jgi:hypothetical protein
MPKRPITACPPLRSCPPSRLIPPTRCRASATRSNPLSARAALEPAVGKSRGTNSSPVFKCPKDDLQYFDAEGSSYEWNFELNGHRIDETRSADLYMTTAIWSDGGPVIRNQSKEVLRFPPETTPLLLDYEDFPPRAPKPAKNVVFMDGHCAGLELLPVVLK